ncbi:MAG: MFS transporter, partial [Acidimicrobiaceae bacterium]|nr:MFS transporter [Acidimicrobiaceae bacterium]
MKTDFYGWNVVGAAFTALFVVYSIQFSFGTFVDDIVEDTGWSETRLQLIFAVYIFTYSSLSAVTGALTDRVGPRRVVAVGSVLLTAGYIIWATAPNLWIAFLGLGVVAPLGMSASWVPCNATVVRWFVERRGTALAIATSGTSMANIIAPPVAATLVKAYGWRTALASFALTGGAAMLLSSLWFRRDPESMGQFPDGKDGPPTPLDQTLISSTDGLTAKAASRTRTYWLILGMYALTFVVVFVPFVHSNQFAIDLGINEITAATVISSIG